MRISKFISDTANGEETTLMIAGENSVDTPEFLSETKNISLRPRTSTRVEWTSVSAWNGAGEVHRTPDVTAILQEIIDNPLWQSGNSMAFVIDGTGQRSARAYDHGAAAAPKLVIAYLPPALTATPTSTATATPTSTDTSN